MKLKKLMKKVLKRVHKLMAMELKRYHKEDAALAKLDQENGVLKVNAPGPYEAIAYVDGSYHPEKGEGSYGIVLIIYNDIKLYSKMVPPNEMEPKLSSTTELHAAATAMNIAASREIKRLVTKYDFVGIRDWALKTQKDNLKAIWYHDVYNTILERCR